MTARQLARALRRARARAETKQPRYERAARKEIRAGLRLAARRFESRATVHLTASGDDPGWTSPAPDELVTLEELIDSFGTTTDPIRQSAIEDYFATFGAAVDGIQANWETTNPLIGGLIEKTGSQVTNVADTTRTSIAGVISRSYEAGLSVQDTAAAIRAYADSISNARATLIARTEFNRLVNGSSLAATKIVAEETGTGFTKVWRTAPGAEYPRHEDYPDLDGQAAGLDGLFDVGEDQLAYPGDPDGEPGETCNCRCSLEFLEQPAQPPGAGASTPMTQQSLATMVDASPLELAQAAGDQATIVEPAVSLALQSLEGDGAELAGFEFRFKTPKSLARKIRDDAEKDGITNAESAAQIVDALRYTYTFEPDAYGAGVVRTLEDLRALGYEIDRTKDYWTKGTQYRGLNVVVKTPGGYSFELQFHTPESFALKNAIHPKYDRWRKIVDKTNPTAVRLDSEMTSAWDATVTPPDIEQMLERLRADGFRVDVKAPETVFEKPAPGRLVGPSDWAWKPGETRFGLETPRILGQSVWERVTLTAEEQDAIYRYTGSFGKQINNWLRGLPASGDEAQRIALRDALDAALAKAPPLEEPVTVFRGLNFPDDWAGPELSEQIAGARGPGRDAIVNQAMGDHFEAKFPVGDVIQWKGYSSTSFALEPALIEAPRSTGIVFEIKTSVGAEVERLSHFEEEAEFLIPRGASFRVVGYERNVPFDIEGPWGSHLGGTTVYRTVVKLEYVNPEDV